MLKHYMFVYLFGGNKVPFFTSKFIKALFEGLLLFRLWDSLFIFKLVNSHCSDKNFSLKEPAGCQPLSAALYSFILYS